MAITEANFTERKFRQLGNRKQVQAKFTGPASYTDSGEPLTNALLLQAFGLTRADQVLCEPMAGTAAGATASMIAFDHIRVSGSSQGKFHIYEATAAAQGNTAAEVAVTSNYSAFNSMITVIGA